MTSDFFWTARLYADGKPIKTMYFATEEERNQYVSSHPCWKKRGKICAENLDRHLNDGNERATKTGTHLIKEKRYGGLFRDQYFNDYFEYMREYSDKKNMSEGKKLLSDATIRTNATDTFFLEKHEDRDFGYWFESDQTMKEAEECLAKHLVCRKNPKKDLKCYMQDMFIFREFLKDRNK